LETDVLVSQLLVLFHLGFDGGDVSIRVGSALVVGVHEGLAEALAHVVVETG